MVYVWSVFCGIYVVCVWYGKCVGVMCVVCGVFVCVWSAVYVYCMWCTVYVGVYVVYM